MLIMLIDVRLKFIIHWSIKIQDNWNLFLDLRTLLVYGPGARFSKRRRFWRKLLELTKIHQQVSRA